MDVSNNCHIVLFTCFTSNVETDYKKGGRVQFSKLFTWAQGNWSLVLFVLQFDAKQKEEK